MITITKEQWKNTPKDYKGIVAGQKYIMMLVKGVTMSCPVKIKEFNK